METIEYCGVVLPIVHSQKHTRDVTHLVLLVNYLCWSRFCPCLYLPPSLAISGVLRETSGKIKWKREAMRIYE